MVKAGGGGGLNIEPAGTHLAGSGRSAAGRRKETPADPQEYTSPAAGGRKETHSPAAGGSTETHSPAAGGRKETPAQEEAVGLAAVRILQNVEEELVASKVETKEAVGALQGQAQLQQESVYNGVARAAREGGQGALLSESCPVCH